MIAAPASAAPSAPGIRRPARRAPSPLGGGNDGTTRRRVRDKIFELKVIERTVKDIYRLLEVEESDDLSANVISLWDYQRRAVASGVNYAEEEADG